MQSFDLKWIKNIIEIGPDITDLLDTIVVELVTAY